MSLDESRRQMLNRLRADQVWHWQRGERLRVEDYLRSEPTLAADPEALLDLIYSELLLREEAGDAPNVAEFVTRFPSLAVEIRRQFTVHAALPLDRDGPLPSAPACQTESSGNPHAPRALLRELPVVPEYELLSELGRGGMGVVYKARHVQLKRTVALKMIRDQVLADATVRARFRAEAEAIARLHHPHIVQIYGCGEHDGSPYLSLEDVAGGSLESWTRPPLHSVRECATLLAIVARAVGYAHQQQIVHRDLKPANILLAPNKPKELANDISNDVESTVGDTLDCQPKITDFGLAKQVSGDSNLTQSEAILGTGAYMSPEQAWGHSRDVGAPTDVHALGVILFELLTGETPFRDSSLMRTLDRVRFEEAHPPSRLNPDIPPALDAICLRCLRKSPAARYPSANALADDLRRFLTGESLPNAPVGLVDRTAHRPRQLVRMIVLSSVSILFLVGMVWGWTRWRPTTPAPPAFGAADTTPELPDPKANSPSGIHLNPTVPRTKPESFAFLVGVRSYRFEDQRIELEFTESDVDELSRLLLKKGYQRSNIRLLTQWGEADNRELAPTGANIRRQLRTMLSACVPGDSVLVAVTGMGGESGAAGMYCYLPSDARLEQPESLISLTEFFDWFRDCRADRKLLLVDTCQTAALDDFDWPERPVPPGVAALFACSPHEISYEHARLRHGVFSYHVLRGLEGAGDVDGDGRIGVGELLDFTRAGVQSFLRENSPGAVQTPMLISTLDAAASVLPSL